MSIRFQVTVVCVVVVSILGEKDVVEKDYYAHRFNRYPFTLGDSLRC